MNYIKNKIQTIHLNRMAIVYIRQSTMRQVLEHKESTDRQYQLKMKAMDLGWKEEDIEVIDEDQGESGASSEKRTGFKYLTSQVALGNVGAIFGLEVSRFTRNCKDLYMLLELCIMNETIIIDDDGIYGPGDYNDKIILGIKGLMSETELHILKCRMHGAKLNAAKKGELKFCLPVGLTYNSEKKIALDPDQRIQQIFRVLFEKFKQLKTARGVVRYFNEHNLTFPTREVSGNMNSPIKWEKLYHCRVIRILNNPIYAGAYAYGQKSSKKDSEGNYKTSTKPMEEWSVLIKNHHRGYISWDEYIRNIEQMKKNDFMNKDGQKNQIAREGKALLQGMVYCGYCGRKMRIHYYKYKENEFITYLCNYDQSTFCSESCQSMTGDGIDNAISNLFLQELKSNKLNIAIKALEKLKNEKKMLLDHLMKKLEDAEYSAERARRQYNKCEPENRLVARTLETEWNEKIQLVMSIKTEIEELKENKAFQITEEQKKQIKSLASNLPEIWYNSKTSNTHKKRLLRIVIDDVILKREGYNAEVTVRWKTGTTTTLNVAIPKRMWDIKKTPSIVIDKVRELAPYKTDQQIADILNEMKLRSGTGRKFTKNIIKTLRYKHKMSFTPGSFRKDILKNEDGLYSTRGLALILNITTYQVSYLRRIGMVVGKKYKNSIRYWYDITDKKIKELKEKIEMRKKKFKYIYEAIGE